MKSISKLLLPVILLISLCIWPGGHISAQLMELDSTGTADNRTDLLLLQATTSKRPAIKFSEGLNSSGAAGMSLEYNGRQNQENNKMVINNTDNEPLFDFFNGGDFVIYNGSSRVYEFLNDGRSSLGGDTRIEGNNDTWGFTNLGLGAPAIRMKKITDITPSGTTSPSNSKSIPHGLDADKILSVSAVYKTNGSHIPINLGVEELRISMFWDAVNIFLINDTGLDPSHLSKPIRITITYEE